MKPKSFSNFQHPVLLLSITLAVSHSPQAHATDGTWTNANGGLWSNTANWSGGVVANGANSTANFSSLALSGYHEVSLDSARTIGNLSFRNSESSSTWLLRNNVNPSNILTLAVSSGSPIIALSYTTQVEISASIAGTAGLTQAGYGAEFYGGTLILSGANTYSGTTYIQAGTMVIEGSGTLGNSSNNLTLAADTLFQRTGGSLLLGGSTQNVGHVEIQGTGDKISGGNLIATHYAIINSGIDVIGNEGQISTISAGLGGATGSLNKSGAGLTILSGTNTYGGSTSIAQGTLQFTRTAALYNGDDTKWTKEHIIVDDSTATLAINVGGAGEFTTQQAKLLLSNLTTGIDNNGLKAGANFAIDTSNAAGDTTFDQVIADSSGLGSGSLSFTKLGSGTLILNQINTHTGTTTVSGGTLAISGAGTLGFNANQAALVVNDSGTLDLGGTSQTVGDVTLSGGSITNGNLIAKSYTVNGSGSNVSASLGEIGGGTSLYVTGGSVTLSGANTYSGPTIINGGGITLSGAGTLGSNPSLYITNGGLNLGGTTQTVGVVEFQGGGSITNGNLVADSFTLSTTSNFSSPNFTANLAGGADLAKYGEGRLTLSGTNSYAGTTTIAEGTLRFNHSGALYEGNQALWNNDKITVASGGTIELAVGGAGGFTIAQSKTLLTNLSTGVDNNGLQAGSTFGISLNLLGGSNQTFDQVIADSTGVGGGAVGFMNRGSHTLTLNQANTYTGTTIVGGSLAISGAGTLGNHANLVVGGENLFSAKLDLGGTTQAVGTVTINNGQVLNGNLSGSSYSVQGGTISAGLGGAGASFTKTGAADSTAYISGTNTYTGTTTVYGGTLYLEKTASLYNNDAAMWTKENISVASGATLAVTVGGAGQFSVAQAKNLLTNLTTTLDNNGLQAGSTFEISTTDTSTDTIFDQAITNSTGAGGGALGFTKQGPGKLILNQTNNYTGPTTVSGGILAISGAGTLGSNSALTVGEYGELDLGGTTQNVGTVSLIGAASNGNLIASDYNIAHNGTISAGLGGTGASLTTASDTSVTLSGTNIYTGTTTVGQNGSLQLTKAASLYGGDASKWTQTNILVNAGTLAVNVGGAGEFSVAQTKTLLTNLTTSVNNNGLTNGSTFGIDTSNATEVTTFNQAITNSTGTGGGHLGFTKLGSNTLILDQTNTYSGVTIVEGGKLVVNGTILASPLTTVKSGATLGGSGTLAGTLIIESGGVIAPGNSAGILRTGDLTVDGTFAAEINGAALGSQYDQIDVTGFVSLGGALAVTTGYTPVWGNLFFLINNDFSDSINGTFTGLAQESEFTMGGQLWRISYNADSGTNQFGGGNDVALMAIPEPNTTILIGLGSLVLLRRRRS